MSEILINVTKVEEVVTINATPNVTQILVNTNTSGGGGIPEAPNNTNAYVRSGLAWIIGYTKTAIDTLLNGKFNNPTGNNTQYLDGSGTPTTFPTIPSISGLATETYVDNGLADKVDKETGKSLILDTEISRLASVTNFDNSGNVTALGTKVDKETGKSLILDTEISRLATMTAIFTTALKTAYDNAVSWISTNGTNVLNHLTRTDNPHSVTKSQVGLSNVDNTSDVNKPVSTAQATADSNVQTFSINRANHIGTQLASTISDFATQVNSLITSALASFKTANFLDFTSSGQTQINTKAADSAVVHNTGDETITGNKTFTNSVTASGGFYSNTAGLSNSNNVNNSKIAATNNGTVITRNVADSSPASTVNQNNTGSTGNIQNFQFNGVTKASVDKDGNLSTPSIILPGGSVQAQLNNKVDKTSWVDYSATSTIVGWSAFTQKSILYKITDGTIDVVFYLEGTSNSASITFTLPNNSTQGFTVFMSSGYNANSGTILANPARIGISNGTNVVGISRDFTGATYATSGTKSVAGRITFKI